MEQRNKGGRPTKAEQAAKGITQSELAGGLRVLKRAFVPSLQFLIEASDSEKLTYAQRVKLKKEIAEMYQAMLKNDKVLIAADNKSGDTPADDSSEPDEAPITFNLAA